MLQPPNIFLPVYSQQKRNIQPANADMAGSKGALQICGGFNLQVIRSCQVSVWGPEATEDGIKHGYKKPRKRKPSSCVLVCWMVREPSQQQAVV